MHLSPGSSVAQAKKSSATSGVGSLWRARRQRLVSGVAVLGLLTLLGSTPGQAREGDFRRFPDYLWLLLGAGAGFVIHESGHLLFESAPGRGDSNYCRRHTRHVIERVGFPGCGTWPRDQQHDVCHDSPCFDKRRHSISFCA